MPGKPETVLYEAHPAMFRNDPLGFLLCIVLIPALGLGLFVLLGWWLSVLNTKLTITNKRSILRRGILSRFETEAWHRDVRTIEVGQSFAQRLFGVGSIGISTAGQGDVEICIQGIPNPDRARAIIDQHRG